MPNHKLGTLVEYRCLPHDGTFHRGLADAELTAHLWLDMLDDLAARYHLGSIPFAVMQDLMRQPGVATDAFLRGLAGSQV